MRAASPPTLYAAIEATPFERARGEVAVASFFASDRPLRGAAGRADWRLCGRLSALIVQGRLTGAAGDALLMPTARRLGAPRLLLLGLGSPQGFGPDQVSAAGAAAAERLLDLRVADAALSLPGEWIGALPARPAAEALLRGVLAALGRRGGSLSLRLLVGPAAEARAARALAAAEMVARSEGVQLRPAAPVGTAAPGGAPRGVPPGGPGAGISPIPGTP